MKKHRTAALVAAGILAPIVWTVTTWLNHSEVEQASVSGRVRAAGNRPHVPRLARLNLNDIPRIDAARSLTDRHVLIRHFDRAQVEGLQWTQIRWIGIPSVLRSSEFLSFVEDSRRLGPHAVDALLELFGRLRTPDNQAIVVLAIGELGSADEVPFLQRVLDGPSGHAYPLDAACAHSLTRIGGLSARVAVAAAMAKSDRLGRATRLAEALAQFGEVAIPDLVSGAAAWAAQQPSDLRPHTWIGALPHDLDPALIDDVILHPDAPLRAMGVYWRATAGHSDGRELLEILHSDQAIAVRTAALCAIALRPSILGIDQLLEFAEDEALGTLAIRIAARHGASAVQPLARLLRAFELDTVAGRAALKALTTIGGPESTTELLRYSAFGGAERAAVLHAITQGIGELDPRWTDLILEDLYTSWPKDEGHQRIAAGVGALLRMPMDHGVPNAALIRDVFHANTEDLAIQRAIVRTVSRSGSGCDFALASEAMQSEDMVTRLLALQMMQRHHGAAVPTAIQHDTKVELLQTLKSGRLSRLATLAQGDHGAAFKNVALFLRRTCTRDDVDSLRAVVARSTHAAQRRILTDVIRDIDSFHAAQARITDG